MREQIRKHIESYAEPQYRDFSASLIPDSLPLLGVRLPKLREIAKKVVKETDWQQEISSYEGAYQDLYFEEAMLRGMIIGYGTAKLTERQDTVWQLVEAWIPHIDNWSICDSFCNSFTYASAHQEEGWAFLQSYLYAEKEFEVRTALILLMNQFLRVDVNGKKTARKRAVTMEDVRKDTSEETSEKYPYLDKILKTLNREFTQGYYAQMAAAWTTAEAFTCFPFETAQMLCQSCKMDDWTYHKALQKICESRIPQDEVKQWIRSLKRKNTSS